MNAALGQLDGLQVLAYGAVWTDGRPARDALDAGARAAESSGSKATVRGRCVSSFENHPRIIRSSRGFR